MSSSTITTQPVIAQPPVSAPVMGYSTNTVTPYKPALLPTPAAAAAAAAAAAVTAPTAVGGSQLDPLAVAAAAALLLAR